MTPRTLGVLSLHAHILHVQAPYMHMHAVAGYPQGYSLLWLGLQWGLGSQWLGHAPLHRCGII